MPETGQTPPRNDRWEESTLSVEAEPRPTDSPGELYLLVFESSSSSMFQLPRHGEVTIGRGDGVAVKLRDSSVSRRHAQIVCSDGEAQVVDLESQNGTALNGERLVAARALLSGDIITVCSATLVFHAHARTSGHRPLLKFEQMRGRLEEEIERSLRYRRPLTLVVALSLTSSDHARATRTLLDTLRGIDVAGSSGGDQLMVLLPEIDQEAAPEAAARISAALSAVAPGARVGYAGCPADGCDLPTLLAAARSAAQGAPAGTTAAASQAFQTKTFGDRTVIIADPAMHWLYSLIERLAASELPVLICGETGTGKELAASAVHHGSARKGPLVALNCAALQETLVESELFGHEKGAFTGATSTKLGLLEAARGGTVMLDEIGEMSPATQAKLLRVLENKRVTRLGDVREREIDIRLVAATNRNLADEVKAGRFRQDLFFRLSGATLWIPPLRDRKRELPILAHRFLADACARSARTMAISDPAMQRLATYAWPGNVRELKNVMDYVAAAFTDPVLEPWHLSGALGAADEEGERNEVADTAPLLVPDATAGPVKFRPIEDELRDLERMRMLQALAVAGGNQTHAAALIAMPLRTFQAKVKHYGLPRPAPRRK